MRPVCATWSLDWCQSSLNQGRLNQTAGNGNFVRFAPRARSVLHDINAEAALEEVDRISAWRCVTCAWTEAPRECLGICVRDRVQFVPATDYDAVAETFADAVQQVAQLSTVVRQFAWVTPRAGEWDRTWRALHSQAVSALGATVQRNEEQISTSPVRS
jgi:hypothetical protein